MPIDEPVSRDAVLWAAHRTVEMHRPPAAGTPGQPGRCASCTDDRCDQLSWATTVLTTAAIERR